MRKVLCIVALFLCAQAADAPAQDAERMAAARNAITAARMDEQFKTLLPLVVRQLKPAIVQGRADVEREFDAMLPSMLNSAFAKVGELLEDTARIYAGNFTADELRELAAFHRSPVGQKFLERQPIIAQQSLALGQKFAQAAFGDLRDRMIEELRKKGYNP